MENKNHNKSRRQASPASSDFDMGTDTSENSDGTVSRPGITADVLKAHTSAMSANTRPKSSPDIGGREWLIPYYTAGGEPLIVNGEAFHRLRPDDSKNGAKYLSPAKSGCQLYIPLRQTSRARRNWSSRSRSSRRFALPAKHSGGRPGRILTGLPGGKMLPALEELLRLHKFETVYFLGDNDTCLNFEFSREAVKLAKALPKAVSSSCRASAWICLKGSTTSPSI